MDASTGEVLLRVGLDEDGCPLARFHLYDSSGCGAAESTHDESFPDGIKVCSDDGEVLLDIPAELDAHIRYRLYNRGGELLTCSDGISTKIQPLLRMEVGGTKGPSATTRRASGQPPPAAEAEAS